MDDKNSLDCYYIFLLQPTSLEARFVHKCFSTSLAGYVLVNFHVFFQMDMQYGVGYTSKVSFGPRAPRSHLVGPPSTNDFLKEL